MSNWIKIQNRVMDKIDVRIRLLDGSELNVWQQTDGDFWSELLQKFITPDQVTYWKEADSSEVVENFAHEPTKEPQTEALNKHNVGGRSELLAAFLRWYWKEVDGKPYEISAEEVVKQFGG